MIETFGLVCLIVLIILQLFVPAFLYRIYEEQKRTNSLLEQQNYLLTKSDRRASQAGES